MLSVTIDMVLSWDPCEEYTRKRIEELFAGRETVNVHDVLSMDIPDEDKLWAILTEELIPADILHEFACRVAEQALLRAQDAGKEPDKRSWQAIEVKRKWLKGEATGRELAEADAAAWAASAEADAEADTAAWAAADTAAWASKAAAWAASAEAEAAAWAAKAAAAWAARAAAEASRAAAEAATGEEQINLLKELLKARGE